MTTALSPGLHSSLRGDTFTDFLPHARENLDRPPEQPQDLNPLRAHALELGVEEAVADEDAGDAQVAEVVEE